MGNLAKRLQSQEFMNEYALVDGVEMSKKYGNQFRIPASVLKQNLQHEYFVELRIDSPRFSMHEEDAVECTCPSCNGEMSKPILRHEIPDSLLAQALPKPPSRGWGEDFWVKIVEREDSHFVGRVDNDLCETKLHGIKLNDEICFHENHVLAVHGMHRLDIIQHMSVEEIKALADWIRLNQAEDQ